MPKSQPAGFGEVSGGSGCIVFRLVGFGATIESIRITRGEADCFAEIGNSLITLALRHVGKTALIPCDFIVRLLTDRFG